MNRHHPYGGNPNGNNFERRGAGGMSGPGPDRPQRFQQNQNRGGRGGGGYGRGPRSGSGSGGGGYSGYDNMSNGPGPYDHGAPYPPDSAPYNNYDGPPQDPYYQNPYGQYPMNPGPPPYESQGTGYGYEGALELPNFDTTKRAYARTKKRHAGDVFLL
ncbi:RRM domain-containing protein [Mycena chlorophos]|uniref:RRM domain-containing protein n=1 Tax=Mycena chlorophos TaxID=658473 RepID=A0A8H6SPH3_MYCCL|nr:RRM domain-containing protein [Mycena chlorophos]